MTAILSLIVIAVLLLAFSNGANDNFKSVATLFGSGTCSYRFALAWATVTTLTGSGDATLKFRSRVPVILAVKNLFHS